MPVIQLAEISEEKNQAAWGEALPTARAVFGYMAEHTLGLANAKSAATTTTTTTTTTTHYYYTVQLHTATPHYNYTLLLYTHWKKNVTPNACIYRIACARQPKKKT